MTISEKTTSRPTLPNQAYDSEYATQFRKEYLYLQEHGIEPSFIKKVGEYRIRTYKYTKTPELFRAVADFYEAHRNEKQFAAMEKMMANATDAYKLTCDIMDIAPAAIHGGVAND